MHAEFLDHRIGEQVRGQFGRLFQRRVVGRTVDLDLEPLTLAHAGTLAVAETLGRIRDRISLRIVNFGLQHDVNNDAGHVSSPGWRGTYAHMHLRQGRSVRDETHARGSPGRQMHKSAVLPLWGASATSGRQCTPTGRTWRSRAGPEDQGVA